MEKLKSKTEIFPYSKGARHQIVKHLLMFTGLLLVGIGGLGVIIPGLPTTIFLILAAGCFSKSSPRLHQRLVENPIFGPIILNWQETRSMPRKAKRYALAMMVLAGAVSFVTITNLAVKILVIGLLLFPIVFVLRLPVTESIVSVRKSNLF